MKYSIKDGNGEEFIVEEKPEKDECANNPDVKKDADPEKKPGEEKHDAEPVTLDEQDIVALKKLASVADKLVGLIPAEKDPESAEDENKSNEPIEDEESEEDDKANAKDSAGSIEKHTEVKDSIEDREAEICKAWADKYAGVR